MKNLDHLTEITDKALGGLTANEAMKQRILAQASAASEQKIVPISRGKRNIAGWVGSAVAAAAVLFVGIRFGIPSVTQGPVQPEAELLQAGTIVAEEAAEESLQVAMLEADYLAPVPTASDSILMITRKAGSGTIDRERADLDNSSVSMQSKSRSSAKNSLWAEVDGESFPMVIVDGRCYRMLNSPDSVSASLLGESRGNVSTFTKEPALADGSGIISNILPEGEAIYPIKSMDSTLLCGNVNGKSRVFQRVSFNGSALRGKDKLADTLQLSGHITGMELSDTGTVSDSATCEALFSTFLSAASYESSGSVSASQYLLIHLDNGLTVQLGVKGERFAACGVWSCPEFLAAFKKAVGQ